MARTEYNLIAIVLVPPLGGQDVSHLGVSVQSNRAKPEILVSYLTRDGKARIKGRVVWRVEKVSH